MTVKAAQPLAAALLLLGFDARLQAVLPPENPPLLNYDKRAALDAPARGTRQAVIQQLQSADPPIRVASDPVTGSARWVRSEDGFLSGPNGKGALVPASVLAAMPANEPHRVLKAFLTGQRSLFGHGAEVLEGARLKRDFVTPHSGLRTVVWEQQLDGIAVFEGLLVASTTKNSELVSVSSGFLGNLKAAADRGVPNRAQLQSKPAVSAPQAVALAARETEGALEATGVVPVDSAPAEGSLRQRFRAAGLKGEAVVELVWLPMGPERLRLCWVVTLARRAGGEVYNVLLDAETGEALVRHCLTSYLSPASYRVFTSDSPSPLSPGYPTPTNAQPPLVSRTLLTLSALDTNASPNGWIDDGVNETRGNNVDAHTDRTDDDLPDLPRPQGSPFRVFDYSMDLTSQDPTNYSAAAVAQVFYLCNWMHDKLYELGFTEAAGNFQNNNFGRGGVENDALQADAQDGGSFNNANFFVGFDGSAPRMQMYIFNNSTPRRDGDLDAEVVLHEYTHGLSNRRVGGGALISALQSAGMGEGWSDFYALALLSEAADDVNGVYPMGAYVSYLLVNLTQNYYFGIRRYPYCTDLNKNPLTFKDIDPGQASGHSGVPRSNIGSANASEVHNQGEVWCVTLWEARAGLIQKYGWAAGNQLSLQLVTDGMNLSPPNPNFLEARDAILQADLVNNGGANLAELWAAFAKRGMGASATSPSSSTTAGVHEAFDMPFDSLLVLPVSGFVSAGNMGGMFFPAAQDYSLFNTGSNSLSWSAGATVPWLGLSSLSGSLPTNGSSATVTASITPAANNLAKGIYTGALWFTNLSSGAAFSRTAKLVVGKSIVGWGDTQRGANVPENLFDVVALSCSSYDNLALRRDGTIFGWGPNYYGATNIPPGLSNVVGLAASALHSLALRNDGTVAAWGNNDYKQLDAPFNLTNAVAVAAGLLHSLALRGDGTVVGWGAGAFVASPQDGYNYGQTIPPLGLSNVVAIAAGHHHSVALKSDGTVVCWGANFYGQSDVPAGLSNVFAIAAGGYHTIALKRDGNIVVWGESARTNVPPAVTNVVAVACGEHHDLALRANGTVEAWGDSLYGETAVPPGLSGVVAIGAGAYHSLALLNDGSLSSPVLFKQPFSRVAGKTTSAVFNASAVGTPALSYRWFKNTLPLSNGSNVAGADSPALLLSNVSLADNGAYGVAVSNQSNVTMSSNATLTVLDPAILVQPASRTNIFGTPASFSVVASGTPALLYRWRRNGTNLFDGGGLSGAATPALSLAAAQVSDAGEYTVVVTNNFGAITSSIATLSLITVPQISIQPMPRTKVPGRTVSFSVTAQGAPPLSYHWVKQGAALLADGGNVSGATAPTLTLSNLTFADSGNYSVFITNDSGSVTSATARLTINTARGHVVAWGTNFYNQTSVPTSLTNVVALDAAGYHSLALKSDGSVVEWGDTNFIPAGITNVAAVDGSANLSLVLKENGVVGAWGLNFYGEATVPQGLSNVVAISAGYSFSAALRADGTVAVWGSNPYGLTNYLDQLTDVVGVSAGDAHLLIVKRDGTVAAFGGNFSEQSTVPAGLSNVVAVAAGGQHSLALKSDGTVVAWGASFCGQTTVPSGLANVVAIAAGLSSSLALKSDGTFIVWGCFDRGVDPTPPPGLTNVAAVSSAYEHALALVNEVLPPVITLAPLSRTNNAGTIASFTAIATGTGPLTYQWRRGGVNLVEGVNISGANSTSLSISNVLKTNEGFYTFAVTDSVGFVISTAGRLTVLDPALTNSPGSRTNIAGSNTTFTVGANGTPPLTYRWFRNGTLVTNGAKISGATTPILSIAGIDQTDAGSYVGVVTNQFRSVTSSPPALLTVIDPLVITLQPASITNQLGAAATFSVSAAGTAADYQWQKDGAVLTNAGQVSGANSATLTLTNLVLANSGNYRVVLTNLAGSVTSAIARLTVLTPLFAYTHPAAEIRSNSARLNGMVAPEGFVTGAWFEWGTGTSYGQMTASQNAGAGQGAVHVSMTVTNLTPGARIHFRLVATNGSLPVYGVDQQFLAGGRLRAWGDNSSGQAATAPGAGSLSGVAGGLLHSVGLRSDGTMVGWGNNSHGQTNAPALTNIAAISAGGFHNVALKSDGTVVAWGRNDSGQTNVPPGLSNVVQIAAGGSHSVALRADGSLSAWGYNAFGQASPPGGLTDVVSIAAGWYHSLALRHDGTVAAWGADTYGQSAPPSGLTNIVWVGAGLYHSLALRNDGVLFAWGYNGLGQVSIPATLSNVVSAACGGSHNLAMSANGTFSAWGYNFYGQSTVPGTASNVVTFAGGGTHSLALVPNQPPVALAQTATGYINADLLLTLHATDPDGDALGFRVTLLPSPGSLYQFAAGGRGSPVVVSNTLVADSAGRLIFAPAPDALGNPYTAFNFVVGDGLTDSAPATTTIAIGLPPAPLLLASSSGIRSNGGFELIFSGASNATYSVWASTNLFDWSHLGPATSIGPGLFRFTDLSTKNWPQRFYRAGAP